MVLKESMICPECKKEKQEFVSSCGWLCLDCVTDIQNKMPRPELGGKSFNDINKEPGDNKYWAMPGMEKIG